jgi:hypothetical protein
MHRACWPLLDSMLESYIYLQNPAWVFRGNVVSHMGRPTCISHVFQRQLQTSCRQLVPFLFDNLHFEHFDKNVNHESRLTLSSKCSKWRLSNKKGTSCRQLLQTVNMHASRISYVVVFCNPHPCSVSIRLRCNHTSTLSRTRGLGASGSDRR